VFVGRRIDTAGDNWQMPQGGIDRGETPRAAALRELKEEVGTDKAVILGLSGETPDNVDIDAAELDEGRKASQQTGEKIPVPDTQYDSDFWRDVDDEGVGGQSGTR